MAGSRLSYTEEQAREAIASSYSWSASLRKLGLCPTGGAWRVLKKYAELWNTSTDHFDLARCTEGNLTQSARPLEEVLVENSTYSRQHVKRRLFKEGLKKPMCEMCGQDEMWHGRPMGMILDHINGVRDDHRPYEQLLAEIEAHGYCWVGRKYGVSDNAVRKWITFYERERERNAGEGSG